VKKSRLRSLSPKRQAEGARSSLTPSPGPTRRAWINRTAKKRKKRKPSETLRIYGPPARRAWIKSLPCFACAGLSPLFGWASQGHSENAHTVTGGTGRKADADTIVPLCRSHHRRYDQHQPPFDRADVREATKAAAPTYDAAWQAHFSGERT
jgi:hypothetical protein